jgi:hypothetical protein
MSEYHRLIEEQIPRLRRYARALTSNRARADDLVQDTLAKEHLWQPGTDLRAWMFTIMHHQNVNTVRHGVRDAAAVDIEQVSGTLSAIEPIFDDANFGYRRGRSTKDALRKVRSYCLVPAARARPGFVRATARAAAGDFARRPGRHVLRRCRGNSKDPGRYRPIAPVARS